MDENSLAAISETTKEVIKPLYTDGLQPATKEVGKSLQTISGLVNVVLMPIAVLVHGVKELEGRLKTGLAEKLTGVNQEDIITPQLNVVGPLLEKYRYNYSNETLSDMFLSLLANSMDRNRSSDAHPSFVDIIGQLSSDEARLFKNIAEIETCPKIDIAIKNQETNGYNIIRKNFILEKFSHGIQYTQNIQAYLENLRRLSLIEYTSGSLQDCYRDDNLYKPLLNDSFVENIKNVLNPELQELKIFKGYIELSSFGRMFFRAITR